MLQTLSLGSSVFAQLTRSINRWKGNIVDRGRSKIAIVWKGNIVIVIVIVIAIV